MFVISISLKTKGMSIKWTNNNGKPALDINIPQSASDECMSWDLYLYDSLFAVKHSCVGCVKSLEQFVKNSFQSHAFTDLIYAVCGKKPCDHNHVKNA